MAFLCSLEVDPVSPTHAARITHAARNTHTARNMHAARHSVTPPSCGAPMLTADGGSTSHHPRLGGPRTPRVCPSPSSMYPANLRSSSPRKRATSPMNPSPSSEQRKILPHVSKATQASKPRARVTPQVKDSAALGGLSSLKPVTDSNYQHVMPLAGCRPQGTLPQKPLSDVFNCVTSLLYCLCDVINETLIRICEHMPKLRYLAFSTTF